MTAVILAGLEGICTFIFEREDDFPEILEFVRDVNREFRLHVEELRGDFRSGLEDLLSRRPIKAVLIGTRRCRLSSPQDMTITFNYPAHSSCCLSVNPCFF